MEIRINATILWALNPRIVYELENRYDDPVEAPLPRDAVRNGFSVPRLRGEAKLHLDNGNVYMGITCRWILQNPKYLRRLITRLTNRGWIVVNSPQPTVIHLSA